MGNGLRMICKTYGSIKVNGGTWFWNYKTDEPEFVKDGEKPKRGQIGDREPASKDAGSSMNYSGQEK
jgi:hypothetical protein